MRTKSYNNKAPIFAIDRLRMATDGHGVTTLVCFMGCPLNCAYCLNELKSATKPFNVLLACTRPLITELSDKLWLEIPTSASNTPYPIMRLETIRSIIPISCRRYPK